VLEAVQKTDATSLSPIISRRTSEPVLSPAGTAIQDGYSLPSSEPPVATQPVAATTSTSTVAATTHASACAPAMRSAGFFESPVQNDMPMGNKSQLQNSRALRNGIKEKDADYPIRQGLRTINPASREVLTNYFEVTIAPEPEFYEYKIIGIPRTITKRHRKPIVNTILQSVPFLCNNEAHLATEYNDTIIA
jgi:hypothetical protein